MNSAPYRCSDAERERLRRLCLEAGACRARFTSVEPVSEREAALYDSWLAARRNGSMAYMERYSEIRRDPALLLEGARTIVSCAFAYRTPATPRSALFADYALGDDYHDVLRRHLQPVADALDALCPGTRICIDTAPLRERYHAVKAGVGTIGLNNLLFVPGVGAAVFLAEILWTGIITPDAPLERSHCNGCGACIAACPHRALDGKGGLDARRCLSYLTIEHRGTPTLAPPDNGRIYGCDICRDACPAARTLPQDAACTVLPEFAPRPDVLALDRRAVADMTQPDFSRIFARSAVKRAKLEGLKKYL